MAFRGALVDQEAERYARGIAGRSAGRLEVTPVEFLPFRQGPGVAPCLPADVAISVDDDEGDPVLEDLQVLLLPCS